MASRGVVTSQENNVYRASESHVIFRPRVQSNPPRPGVLLLGGLGTTAATWLTPTFRIQPDLCAASGLSVLGADQGGSATWGNDDSIAAADAMHAYLLGFGKIDAGGQVALVAGSMGAAIACNWARQNLASIACIHLTIPAVDLEDIRANNRGGYAASIETAYTNNATWQTARPTHNPVEYAEELADIPIQVLYSTNDTICTPATVLAFAAACDAEVVSLGAVGHVGTGQDYAASMAWINGHLN